MTAERAARYPSGAAPSGAGATARRAPFRRLDLTRWASYGASALALGFLAVLVATFAVQSLPAWRAERLAYLTGRTWFYRAGEFGVLPMVYGTAAVSAVALVLAAPVALGTAAFTAELATPRLRWAVKVPVELLAGVPSVVYGLLGILFLRDWIYRLLRPWEPLSGDTLLTGGVLLAVMILPTLTTLADDALRGVPASQRRAARALGLTRAEAMLRVSIPQALPGLAAAVLLALGRALGETIAVFLVIGRQDNQWPERFLTLAPLARAGQTLTTKLGGSETHIAWGDPLHWGALAGLALVLSVMVAAVTLAGARLAAGPGGRAATRTER